MNNKGFTLVELLAVVAIISILAGVAVPAVSKHLKKTKKFSYENTQESICDAANNKIVDDLKTCNTFSNCTFTIDTLITEGYLEKIEDPNGGTCSGSIKVKFQTSSGSESALDEYVYEGYLKCGTQEFNFDCK